MFLFDEFPLRVMSARRRLVLSKIRQRVKLFETPIAQDFRTKTTGMEDISYCLSMLDGKCIRLNFVAFSVA